MAGPDYDILVPLG